MSCETSEDHCWIATKDDLGSAGSHLVVIRLKGILVLNRNRRPREPFQLISSPLRDCDPWPLQLVNSNRGVPFGPGRGTATRWSTWSNRRSCKLAWKALQNRPGLLVHSSYYLVDWCIGLLVYWLTGSLLDSLPGLLVFFVVFIVDDVYTAWG